VRATVSTDFERFCAEFRSRTSPKGVLDALTNCGLAEEQVMAMLYAYAHGHRYSEGRDQAWLDSADALQEKMRQLARQVHAFNFHSASIKFIAALKANATAFESASAPHREFLRRRGLTPHQPFAPSLG
jgi:hypothetical protein